LYATCSFVGAWSYLLIFRVYGNDIIAAVSCIVITFILRMLALQYRIRLPI
jgi:uncharacterized membrane protein YeiH